MPFLPLDILHLVQLQIKFLHFNILSLQNLILFSVCMQDNSILNLTVVPALDIIFKPEMR